MLLFCFGNVAAGMMMVATVFWSSRLGEGEHFSRAGRGGGDDDDDQ